MPKIFVLRNRLQEQQARLLETQKGQHIKIRTDELSTDAHLNQQHRQQQQQQNHGGSEMQDEPVALIVDRKSDITAAVAAISLTATTSDKDNHQQQQQPAPPCQQQQPGKTKLKIEYPHSLIDLPRIGRWVDGALWRHDPHDYLFFPFVWKISIFSC